MGGTTLQDELPWIYPYRLNYHVGEIDIQIRKTKGMYFPDERVKGDARE